MELRMQSPPERQNWRLMRDMFGAIAPRYDFVTRVFSYGMDRRWKRLGVSRALLTANAVVLDLACGTGDFSQLVRLHQPRARVVSLDLTPQMLQLARSSGLGEAICGDAARLPFADACFHGVFIGYGLRNFPDLDAVLREIERVTKAGGFMVSLDFFLPANRFMRKLYLGYLYLQGAVWGMLLHGRPRVYTYIPDSLRSFLSIGDFSNRLGRVGYSLADARAFIFGGIGLHWAVKNAGGKQN